MSTLLFGIAGFSGVPADEEVVRSTATPVTSDAPPAVMDNQPDQNEVETDPNPDLGMVNRTLASAWTEGEQYPPFWAPEVDNATEYNARINRQVSSSGTAAAREESGQFGHGTLSYAVGIEPVGDLNGQHFGNEYFAAEKETIQQGTGTYMTTPPGYDHTTTAMVNATGKKQAREASNASPYDVWWRGFNA